MFGLFEGWPPEAVGALILSVAGHVWQGSRAVYKTFRQADGQETQIAMQGWQRARELEAVVDLLRRVIDRLRRQQNAYATSYELLLVVVPENPSQAQRRALERAEELFETALLEPPSDGQAVPGAS